MSEFTSISTDRNQYPLKPLDEDGKNYQTWSMRMELILQGRHVWDMVDPSSLGVPKPLDNDPKLEDWIKRNMKAMIQIKCYISDTALLSLRETTHTQDTWTALSDHYNGVGAQDASIITSRLHHFWMDNSKPLEPQINMMHELKYQLASLGDEISDVKFAMILSEALPPSYQTLKTITVATVTDAMKLATNTLVLQILQEEKHMQHENGVTAMFARSSKPNCKDMQKSNVSKSNNTTKSTVQCTNPKCGRPGHTFEQCWAEGGGNEGRKKRQCSRCATSTPSLGAPKESTKVASSSDTKQEMLIVQTNDQSLALLANGQTCRLEWIVNSSATSHLCGNHEWFTSFCPLNPLCEVILRNKHLIFAPRIGQIEVTLEVGNLSQLTTVHDVLYCPKIAHNLLSVPQLTSIGAHVRFVNKACQIYNSSKKLITIADLIDGLYRLPVKVIATEKAYITVESKSDSTNIAHSITASASLDVWHVCLGHISIDSILKMLHSGMVTGMEIISSKSVEGSTYCSECEASSHHCNPIPSETHTQSNQILGWVFSDVCEVQTVMCEGFRYFITFVSDFSRFLVVYLMKNNLTCCTH